MEVFYKPIVNYLENSRGVVQGCKTNKGVQGRLKNDAEALPRDENLLHRRALNEQCPESPGQAVCGVRL